MFGSQNENEFLSYSFRLISSPCDIFWFYSHHLYFVTNSVGCIFGELLIKDAILKGNGELDVSLPFYLRPDYSLSTNVSLLNLLRSIISASQQIQQIFKLLGPPNETSWPTFSSLPSSGTFKWKSGGGEGSRSSTSSTSSSDLRRRFSVNSSFSSTGCQSYLDSAGFDLLEKLLTLDPARRMNARDALNHDYFKGGGGVKMQVPDFFFSS